MLYLVTAHYFRLLKLNNLWGLFSPPCLDSEIYRYLDVKVIYTKFVQHKGCSIQETA